MLEWLVRLLNLSFDMGVVPMAWRGACLVPLYKGKGDKCECSNSRGISLLSVVIIYHDFIPTPRRGCHVKSDKTHTQSSRYTP